MFFYFSGIRSAEEVHWLQQAGVQRLLVDPVVLGHVKDWQGDTGLEYGADQAFQSGQEVTLEHYHTLAQSRAFSFVVAPNQMGDLETSLRQWQIFHRWGIPNLVPVWTWGAPIAILHQFLDQAPLVGIGSCVPWMRVDTSPERTRAQIDADKAHREENFQILKRMCQAFGQHLHLFGLCWVRAMEELADLLFSADSSHWLVGGRRGDVIFQHSRTGHLSQAPAHALRFAAGWNRQDRCIANAQAIAHFLGEPLDAEEGLSPLRG